MFCLNCGKQVKPGVKYCPYCDCQDFSSQREGTNRNEPVIEKIVIPERKKPVKTIDFKKWLLPICISIIGILTILVVILLVLLFTREKEAEQPVNTQVPTTILTPTTTPKEQPAKETENEETEPPEDQIVYPQQIKLEEEIEGRIKEFCVVLDLAERIRIKTETGSNAGFYNNFLEASFQKAESLFLIKQNYAVSQTQEGNFILSEETYREYLLDSIGTYEETALEEIKTGAYAPFLVYQNETIEIQKRSDFSYMETVTIKDSQKISENKIQLQGSILLETETGEQVTTEFQITMEENSNSIFGGYHLTEINELICEEIPVEEYLLPESSNRYYLEEELKELDGTQLRLARNEIFAKHGYIFKDATLKAYFEKQSWYTPLYQTVNGSKLNQYETANVNLLLKLEEQFE